MKEETRVVTYPVAEWIRSNPDELKEFILEIERPKRKVRVKRLQKNRSIISGMVTENTQQEAVDPVRIFESVQNITRRDTILLKSVGAIAFLAKANELDRIASIPGVKKIHFNRRLHPAGLRP